MPMYDYQCPKCGAAFEELRPLAERDTAPCPECGATAQKQISSFFTSGAQGTPSRGGGSCDFGGFGGG